MDGKPNVIVLTSHSSLLTAHCDPDSSYTLRSCCRSIYSIPSDTVTLPLLTLTLFSYCLILVYTISPPSCQFNIPMSSTSPKSLIVCHYLLMLYYWKFGMPNLNIQFQFPLDTNFISAITLVHMRSLQLQINLPLTSVSDSLAPSST